MNAAELCQKLSLGPLSELPIGGKGSGTILPESLPKILMRANLALIALYTRFPLQLRQITLATVTGLHTYPLRYAYAQTSSSTEPVKFIQDTVADPFRGDVLAIEGVYDGEHGLLPLNIAGNELSWFTHSYDTLAVDYPRTGDVYFVEYRARHAEIPLDADLTALEGFEIRVPVSLEGALLAKIAGDVYSNMSMEGALSKSQLHLAEYEAICSEQEARNTAHSSTTVEHDKFRAGGWV